MPMAGPEGAHLRMCLCPRSCAQGRCISQQVVGRCSTEGAAAGPRTTAGSAREVGCIVVDKDGGSWHAARCLAACAWTRRILERVGSRGRGVAGVWCVSIRGLPHARTCCCGGMLLGYLLEGQTHASMLRCMSNASARVVMCGSFCVVVHVRVRKQSINSIQFNF